ncbi:MAG TPA: hypothetical protein VM659_28580 [Dongiaceae bacterium]|nr:hypothetical protein [Dongiaceae bacterium]
MISRADWTPQVSDEAFAFLAIQRGRLNDIVGNRAAWLEAYKTSLFDWYETALPYLPEACGAICDIGGGMGGIDALLSLHYGGTDVFVLDGVADQPIFAQTIRPFNDMRVTARFLAANGIETFGYFPPASRSTETKFDLILSCQAWCFHLPPAAYAEFALDGWKNGTRMIVDLRRGRTDWREELEADFGRAEVIHQDRKFERLVFGHA